MQSIEQNGGICKSVFKNSSPAEIKKSYNRRWIELINRMEKQRQPAITRQT